MLLKVEKAANGSGTTLENMHVPDYPEMALFQTAIEAPRDENDEGKLIVTCNPPPSKSGDDTMSAERRLEIPLRLRAERVKKLKALKIDMHESPTTGYDMGAEYNDWFSTSLGYPVVLAYLGANTRSVLGTLAPRKRNNEKWWTMWRDEFITETNSKGRWSIYLAFIYFVGGVVYKAYSKIQEGWAPTAAIGVAVLSFAAVIATINWYIYRRREDRISFADCAPYLVISETSIDNVSARLPDGEEVDRTKFRPNIVVSGAKTAFEEDFWTELGLGPTQARLLLTGNCVRCSSLNVNFQTGKLMNYNSGNLFKKLMRDRRVDSGARYSPVFGRYSFVDRVDAGKPIRVGDSVEILARGKERTVTGEFIPLLLAGLVADDASARLAWSCLLVILKLNARFRIVHLVICEAEYNQGHSSCYHGGFLTVPKSLPFPLGSRIPVNYNLDRREDTGHPVGRELLLSIATITSGQYAPPQKVT